MENQNQSGDLFAKLQGILSTKEGQEQLKNISSMFSAPSANNQQQSQQPPPPPDQANTASGGGSLDMNAISSLLQGFMSNQGGAAPQENQASGFSSPSDSPLGGIDMGMILKLQQVFQGMNKSDKNTNLLLALKPHFSEKRSQKVDHAISMMRLLAMLPSLKESGIFKGL